MECYPSQIEFFPDRGLIQIFRPGAMDHPLATGYA